MSGSVELNLAHNKLSVWRVCRAEVRRRTEWEEAHKVLWGTVSRSSVSVKVGAAHRNCHAHTRLFITWDQFNLRLSLKHSLELDAPARPPVLLVRRKFLDMAINLPVGLCGQFCVEERATLSKV
jgi:hypothetical protein